MAETTATNPTLEDRVQKLEEAIATQLPALRDSLTNIEAALAVKASSVLSDFESVAVAKITALEQWAKTIGSNHTKFTPASTETPKTAA